MPNGVNGIQYTLKTSDPLWDEWETVRTELADTLTRYGSDHQIEIRYNQEAMYQQERIRKSREKKKALGAATPKTW